MAISETITVDAAEAITSLDEFAAAAERAAERFAAAQDKIKTGLGGAGGSAGADKLAASMDKAAASVEAAVGKINAAMDKLGSSADKAAAGLGRLDEVAAEAEGSLSAAAAGADEAAAANDRLAASADDAGAALDRQAAAGARAGETGKAAAEGGGGWKTLSTVMLGAGIAAAYGIDKAMKFQSQMLLLHTQAGVSSADVKTISQGVLQISAQTGQSLSSVAESAYHVASNMASMGGKPVQMLQAVKIAAEGAAVGHSNLVDTTTALTSVLASGIPGAKNYAQAMGAINATVGSGEMNMQQLAEAMGTGVVPVVKGYGLTLKDVGAALAVYGDMNIRGAHAGTQLRMAVQALAVPMKTGPLKEYGLTMNTLANDMQNGGLLHALDDLQARFHKAGLTAKDEGQAITALFGKKAGAGLALLMENMDRFQSKFPYLTQQANSFNKAWEATQQSPQQKWKELTASLQVGAVNFGTALLPAFSTAVGFADKILADINGTKGGARDIAIAFGGLAALFTGKKLVSGVESAFSTGQSVLRGVGKISETLNIPGLSKLAGIGQNTGLTGAATSLDGAATNLDGAAEALTGAAEKLAGGGGLGGTAGRAGGGAAAAGEGAAAAGTAGETVGLSAGMLAGPVLGAVAGLGLGLFLNKYEKYDHPAPADQLGPRSAGAPASAATAYKQYDQFTPTVNTSALEAAKAKVQADMKQIDSAISQAKAAKLPAPDLSALESAKATIKADLNSINTQLQTAAKPPKVASPDMSALASAKATAAQQAEGIHTAAQTPVSKPVKAAPPDLSALAAAKGKAAADGAAMSAGLAQGILSEEGAVVAAANQVASAAAAAMAKALQVHSPSKVTQKIGAQTVEGLVVGLEGGQAAVTAAAQALGRQTAKAADVTAIDSAITKAIGYAGKDSALVKYLKGDQAKLLALAAKRQQLETEIADAQQITTQAISSANITSAGSYTPVLAASSGPLAASSTITGMQGMAADQKQFASVIGQLQKQGLNATSLSQLVQAGPSSLPQALGLAQGGKAAINQVNTLESQIVASAKKLGNTAAPAMYTAGVQAGQGLAAGLKSQLGALDSTIQSLANELVQQIKKDLHISSPSQVFADIGTQIPAGLAQGIDGGTGAAAGAVSRMAGMAVEAARAGHSAGYTAAGYGQGGAYPSSGRGGGTVVHNHYNVTVQGHVTTENNLLDRLQELQLAKADRNWQGGWTHPGRAA